MGRHDKITPDIVEWLISDEKVVSKWKSFASRIGLESYVPKIDENYSYKKKKFEKQKMKELLDVWRRASPITYTKSRLMEILAKEDLNDMFMWIQLMNTENSTRKSEISYMLHSPRSAISLSPQPGTTGSFTPTPGPAAVPSSAPPGIYNPHQSSSYSWYFDTDKPQSILKKHRPASDFGAPSSSNASNKSDCDYQYIPLRNSTDSNASRESTPESLSRPLSRLSMSTNMSLDQGQPLYSTPKPKSIRFADDLEESCIDMGRRSEKSLGQSGHKPDTNGDRVSPDLELLVRSPRRGTDNSVEKYFDNLITMIEDAAEGL